MSDTNTGSAQATTEHPAPTQASLGHVRTGVVRNAIQANIQPSSAGIIDPFKLTPPGGVFGWQRVRIANYSPYPFRIIGIPGGGRGDPPQVIQPYQQNVFPYYGSSGAIEFTAAIEDTNPLATPPLRFAYSGGSAGGELLFNYMLVEWTDTPDLFFGYYPIPLTGITVLAAGVASNPTVIPVGTDPLAISYNPATNRIYVANATSKTLSVIDGSTNTVIATVTFPNTPVDVSANSATNKVYVAFSDDHLVSIVDGSSNLVIGTVDMGANHAGIVVDLVTNKKYVTLTGTSDEEVGVILANDTALMGTISVGSGSLGLDVDTNTGQVYVCNSADGTVTQIDEATEIAVQTIVVGNTPTDIAIDSALGLGWVTNHGDNTVSEINLTTHTVVNTIVVGTGPKGIAVDYVTQRVYVCDNGANTITVIDEASHVIIDTLSPGVGPIDCAVDYNTNILYTVITANAVSVLPGV